MPKPTINVSIPINIHIKGGHQKPIDPPAFSFCINSTILCSTESIQKNRAANKNAKD